MTTRAAVLYEVGAPPPYAESLPLVTETVTVLTTCAAQTKTVMEEIN